MKLVAKKPLSVGVKAALITALTAILVALIQLMRNATPTNSQTANNSPGAIQAGGNVSISPVVVVQPDYIEGTSIGRQQFEHFFPFGYAIIYPNEDGEKRTHEVHNNMMNWKIDWNKVKIEPDFQGGMVTFTVPDPSATGNNQIVSQNSLFSSVLPLTNGICRRIGFNFGNNPVPNVCVLNTDERNPVFAIGFRIPANGEGRPPNPPYFFIQQ
jgi:hypothetical protein